MASEDSTDVFVDGAFATTLNAGESYVVNLPTDPGLEITSSASVQVDVSLATMFCSVSFSHLITQSTHRTSTLCNKAYWWGPR
jgi:hypothetical protein